MTLSTTAARVSYVGNGVTASFAFAFKIWAASDLKVYLRDTTTLADTLQVLTADYTVTGTLPGTGNVVFVTAPAAGKTVVILRDAAQTQDLDLIPNGAFAADNVEFQLDKLTGFVQTLKELINRCLVLPPGTALANLTLPEPALAKAAQVLGVNNTGDGYALIAQTNVAVASVSSYIATLIGAVSAAAARATLGIGSTTLSATTVMRGSVTIDVASIAHGANSATFNISVPGAISGDYVIVAAGGSLNGLVLSGEAILDNVRCTLVNQSGVAVDLPSYTYYAIAFDQNSFPY